MKPNPSLSLWRVAGVLCCLFSPVAYFYLRYLAAVLVPLLVVVLLAQGWRKVRPLLHRLAAACILALCQPRPIDKKLYTFCYPDYEPAPIN